MTDLSVYSVTADRNTGEWIDEPKATGATVDSMEWSSCTDTDDTHFDTYEHFPLDETGQRGEDSETRAVIVRWVE